MFKKLLLITLSTLFVSPFVIAKPSLLMPKKEQPEDMRYYQPYKWDTPIERKVIYEAKANGQYHMFSKMLICQSRASYLEQWLNAFKKGSQEVGYTESDFAMRDMDDNQIDDPDDGEHLSKWLVRDYAEQHYLGYTGKNLAKLQDSFFSHCLAKLPVKLFTKEAKALLRAKEQADIDREMAYP